jgi:hypothetical protein
MQHFLNSISRKYPDFIMQVTCETDNPMDGHPNENVAIAHLCDNGIVGMYRRTDSRDNVTDLFDCIGLFPLEGLAATWGEDCDQSWFDNPNWFYQFLLARHTSIYSFPGEWTEDSIKRMRVFNDWRKSPRILALLNEQVLPVYEGAAGANFGPWAWMFINDTKSQGLLLALDHQNTGVDGIVTNLRYLNPEKKYLVENITLTKNGFDYRFEGIYDGKTLQDPGFKINLASTPDRCAAFWFQEITSDKPAVLYADHHIVSYEERPDSDSVLHLTFKGTPNTNASIIVYKPQKQGTEQRQIMLDAQGLATADFYFVTVIEDIQTVTKRWKTEFSHYQFAKENAEPIILESDPVPTPKANEMNWALSSNGSKISASSVDNYANKQWGPNGCIDGDQSSNGWGNDKGWASLKGEPLPQFIEVEFAEPHSISRFIVTTYQDSNNMKSLLTWAVRNYDIVIWNDISSQWETIVVESYNRYCKTRVHELSSPITIKKFRVIVTKGSRNDNQARLLETEAWGEK